MICVVILSHWMQCSGSVWFCMAYLIFVSFDRISCRQIERSAFGNGFGQTCVWSKIWWTMSGDPSAYITIVVCCCLAQNLHVRVINSFFWMEVGAVKSRGNITWVVLATTFCPEGIWRVGQGNPVALGICLTGIMSYSWSRGIVVLSCICISPTSVFVKLPVISDL